MKQMSKKLSNSPEHPTTTNNAKISTADMTLQPEKENTKQYEIKTDIHNEGEVMERIPEQSKEES